MLLYPPSVPISRIREAPASCASSMSSLPWLGLTLIVGSPARAVRTLDDKAHAMIAHGADVYVRRYQRYAKGLKRIG